MNGIDLSPIFNEINSQSDAFSLQFAQLVFEKYINARSIKELHDVKTGVKNGSKIPLADLGKNYNYMKSKEGLTSQCDFNECEVSVKFSVKKWETHAYNCEVKLCRKDLEPKFLEWFGANGDEDTDVEDAFIQFLLNWIGDALIASHWVKVWFTSNSYPNTSDLYGADGLFTQMLANAPAGNPNRIEIPENANIDYATQLSLASNRAFKVFSEMYYKSLTHKGLRGVAQKAIYTTEDLAVNYLRYLIDNKQVNCCIKDITTEQYNLEKLNIFGLPIKIVREFDDIIQGADINGNPYFPELNNGTKYNNPHRAVLTYKENIPVGTINQDRLDDTEVVYDKVTRKMHIRSEYEVGSKVLIDNDVIIAV